MTTIKDNLTIITAALNVIPLPEQIARIFNARLVLWYDMPTPYTTQEEYEGALYPWLLQIDRLYNTLVKNYGSTRVETVTHTKGTKDTITHTGTDTVSNGKITVDNSVRNYPIGYIGQDDPDYLTTNSNDTTTSEPNITTHNTTDSTDHTGVDVDSVETYDARDYLDSEVKGSLTVLSYIDYAILSIIDRYGGANVS